MTQEDLDKLAKEDCSGYPYNDFKYLDEQSYQVGFKKALELVNEQFKQAEYTIDAKVWLVESIYNLSIGK